MSTCLFIPPVLLIIILSICKKYDAQQYAAVSRKRCFTDFKIEWSRELGSSPFVGMPVITDVNGDGSLDIVAVSFSGEVHVVQAHNGQPLLKANWPFKLAHSSVLTSPLQHDMNKDGMLDIVITSADGLVTTLSQDGEPLSGHSYQIDPLYVKRDWHLRELTADKGSVHDYILNSGRNLSNDAKEHYVSVDPHILASPVIADLNQDGNIEEMVIPISFYFDQNYYSTPEGLDSLDNLEFSELSNYLASALLILNTTSMEAIRTLHLELTKTTAEYPGYLLFPPTLADLDGSGGQLEVVVGTSAGQVHAFDIQGNEREGFPIPTDTVHGQITVEDVNMDGKLELIVVDVSGNVGCYDTSGRLLWEAQISGSSSPGSLVADLNLDGKLDVLIAANDGQIWGLSGDTGEVLNNWPIKVGQKLVSQPLITKLNEQTWPTVISVTEDGHLHMLKGNGKCRHVVNLGETSLVPVLSHDLIPTSPGLELLVATQDGTLMCLSQKDNGQTLELPELYAWPSEHRGTNSFTFHDGKYGLLIKFDQKDLDTDHTSASFFVTFTIVDTRPPVVDNTTYTVNIYIGSIFLAKYTYSSAGKYTVEVSSPNRPLRGQVVIVCTDNLGKIFQAHMPIKFHMTVFDDVKWLLIGPVIGMSLTLLFVHGFPDSDLLPTSMPTKNR